MSRFGRGLGAAAVSAVVAVLIVVVVAVATGPGPRPPGLRAGEIVAGADTMPRRASFGDTLVTKVGAVLDRRRVDAATLRLEGGSLPYLASTVKKERRDVGATTRLTYTLTLRCLVRACLPNDPLRGGRTTIALPPLRLSFRRWNGASGSLLVSRPAVEVFSRLTKGDEIRLGEAPPPFRVSAVLPRSTYAIPPTLLVVLLLVAAAVLLTAGGWLALRALPRRAAPAAEPMEPPVELSPLERALLLLERARARGPVPEQRKALELLAGELGRDGEARLAASARVLAWSEQAPPTAATAELAGDVRRAIERKGDGSVG